MQDHTNDSRHFPEEAQAPEYASGYDQLGRAQVWKAGAAGAPVYTADRPYYVASDCHDYNAADEMAAAIAGVMPRFSGTVINAALRAAEEAQDPYTTGMPLRDLHKNYIRGWKETFPAERRRVLRQLNALYVADIGRRTGFRPDAENIPDTVMIGSDVAAYWRAAFQHLATGAGASLEDCLDAGARCAGRVLDGSIRNRAE